MTNTNRFEIFAARAEGMTIAQLEWAIKDAYQASIAVDGFDSVKAGLYLDEAYTYQAILAQRDRK